jgi:hypothetical protein
MLAYAMTIALPESWSTQKQSLWLQEPLKFESVASAIRAEWQRRLLDSGGAGMALPAQQQVSSISATRPRAVEPTGQGTRTRPASTTVSRAIQPSTASAASVLKQTKQRASLKPQLRKA